MNNPITHFVSVGRRDVRGGLTTARKERFARTTLGSFWLGLSNLLSIAALAVVYGSVFKVQNLLYVVYLGTGLVIGMQYLAHYSQPQAC